MEAELSFGIKQSFEEKNWKLDRAPRVAGIQCACLGFDSQTRHIKTQSNALKITELNQNKTEFYKIS